MTTPSPASIATHFSQLEDPRRDHLKLHSLHDILVLSICGTICGADGFTAIEEYGHAKEDWLSTFLDLKNGIPSHDTIGRVFSLIETEQFERCFLAWMQSVFETTEGEVVALDGKRLRGSYDRASNQAALHMVGAWATENCLLLGGIQTEDKSNEIKAIPELIRLLDLHGCIVTIDAVGCQREIAQAILERGADYVLSLKANQGGLCADVEALFDRVRLPVAPTEGVVERGLAFAKAVDGAHGRIEQRRCWALPVAGQGLLDLDRWPGLRTVVLLERIREVGSCTSVERHYYISSLPAEAGHLLRVIRRHWHVENRLHWVLDVAFEEDQSRIRSGHAAANLALVRRLAVSALQRERSLKRGIAIKRLRAGWDQAYLFDVLQLV
jgi:predicted transposase YbfD/YdcC